MPSYVSPKKNTAFVFSLSLLSQASAHTFQTNPTLAVGDVKVSIDGGALANLTTLPTVTPAGGKLVRIALAAAEMNGDNVTLVFSDVAGAEWDDVTINIQTSVRQMDDLAVGNPTVGGYAAGQDPATLVLDALAASHNGANTIGSKVNSAASAGDPLLNSVPGSYAAGTAGYVLGHSATTGLGAVLTTFTVTDGTNPLDGVLVEISTDLAKTNVIASGYTLSNGIVKLNLDPGTYYKWLNLAGYDFVNPQTIVVS